jgi:hypothetical protein
MGLRASDKLQAVLVLGRMEHDEDKILYQFVIGGMISVSVALIVGIIQGNLSTIVGIAYLLGFWEFGAFIFIITKKRLINLRNRIALDIKKL